MAHPLLRTGSAGIGQHLWTGRWQALRLALALATGAVALSGCAAYDRSSLVATGPGADLNAAQVAQFVAEQDKLLTSLVAAAQAPAGLASAPAATVAGGAAPVAVAGTTVSWDQVIRAGMDHADGRCEAYLHALFRLNRDKKTATAQTQLLGTATAGVQAALGEAAKQVAITAVLFGLAGSTIDNVAGNLLYELEPSSVRALVKALQSRYRSQLGTGYPDRPAAMSALRGYAVLCVPANIEAEVNLAVKKTQPEAQAAKPAQGQPPVVTNASIAISSVSFSQDEASNKLDAFVNPGGRIDQNNERRLLDYMQANGVARGIGTTSFIFGKPYEAARRDAAKHFGL